MIAYKYLLKSKDLITSSLEVISISMVCLTPANEQQCDDSVNNICGVCK